MIKLGLNIDHVATLRQARYAKTERLHGGLVEPDPIAFALEAQRHGADGITVHPREDQRHMQRADIVQLKALLQVPVNMEMATTADMLAFAMEILPATVCLVPEKREEVTTEGGLDLRAQRDFIREIIQSLSVRHVATSLFIDPDPEQIATAIELRPAYIELHTGSYANAWGSPCETCEWERLAAAAKQAQAGGLIVNLGHGINYHNVHRLLEIPGIREMNIGHSIIARAVFSGMADAIQAMKRLMNPCHCPCDASAR